MERVPRLKIKKFSGHIVSQFVGATKLMGRVTKSMAMKYSLVNVTLGYRWPCPTCPIESETEVVDRSTSIDPACFHGEG
jgi:hypothetical protein